MARSTAAASARRSGRRRQPWLRGRSRPAHGRPAPASARSHRAAAVPAARGVGRLVPHGLGPQPCRDRAWRDAQTAGAAARRRQSTSGGQFRSASSSNSGRSAADWVSPSTRSRFCSTLSRSGCRSADRRSGRAPPVTGLARGSGVASRMSSSCQRAFRLIGVQAQLGRRRRRLASPKSYPQLRQRSEVSKPM